MSWEQDSKKAAELYPLMQKNDMDACGLLLELIERYAGAAVKSQLKDYNIYDTELEQEIMAEGCVTVCRKLSEGFWQSDERIAPEDVLRYCVGIYRRLAVRYGTKKAEELVHSQSLEGMEEGGQPLKTVSDPQGNPFDYFWKKEQFQIISQVIHMYMTEFFDFKREPYMLLCLGYAKILSHIIGDENKNNAVDWAFQYMKDHNVGQLSEEFKEEFNSSDREHQYEWGERYLKNLNKAYICEDEEVIPVSDIVITEEFHTKAASQWCIRVNKAIIDKIASSILKDPTMTEILMEYADFKAAANKVKSRKKGDRA